jgi:molybdate transport system substrate-binding protein
MRLLLSTVLALLVLFPASAHAATVYAAASLREAFPEIDGGQTYNFAGSNQLQAQIERGAPADVFASASPAEARALFHAGRCTRPQTIATNVVAMLVPARNPAGLASLQDLQRGPRQRLAVGTANVPTGAYTRELLARQRLGGLLARHTVSEEPNVSSITSKVALGSADAGFAYLTDARAAGRRVTVVGLPARAQPPIRYLVCAVLRPGADTAAAHAFIEKVRSAAGRRVLSRWGFGLPPRG